MKKTISLILAAVLTALCFAMPVSAATDKGVIYNEEQRTAALTEFNTAVNAIKTVRPYCKMTTTYTLDDPTIGSIDGEPIAEEAQKWIKWIIDACFKPGSGMANKLFSTIFNSTAQPEDCTFLFGEVRNNRVPVSGKEYVSALTSSDNFKITQQYVGGSALHPENAQKSTKVFFDDIALEDAKFSGLPKVFNMTSGEFNPIIVSEEYVDESGKKSHNVLDGVTFDNFYFTDAYIQIKENNSGELTEYISNINYSFSMSLYDFINLISVTTGYDFVAFAAAIADTIGSKTGKGGLSTEEVLKSKCIYINYNVVTKMTGFSWAKRYFGDIDSDNTVTVSDARTALRHAVNLQQIKNQSSLMYGDIDFNGDITVADARLILRAAVGLDDKFSEVPEGKTVKIVEVEEEPLPPEEEKPPVSEDPDLPDTPGSTTDPTNPGIDMGESVAAFISAIYDVIEAGKGATDTSDGALADLIAFFRSLGGNNAGQPAEN